MKDRNMMTLIKLVFLAGISIWMTIIVFNHLDDLGTNIYLLSEMFSMEKIVDNPHLGNGLESRSIKWAPLPKIALISVIVYQLINVVFLWIAVFFYARFYIKENKEFEFPALYYANRALTLLLFMWLSFMCGGLYFGYWINLGAVQSVHINLLVITLIGFILINTDHDKSLKESII